MDPNASDIDYSDMAEAGQPIVDSSLVAAMLALTPEERLRQNDRVLRTIKELRDGIAARRSDDPPIEARVNRR